MYIIKDTTGAATLSFYENLNSYSIPDGARIIIKFTGLQNNYQRSVLAVPTNADTADPTYDTNDRYWKLTWSYVVANNKTHALTHDIRANKLGGTVVLPAPGIYNIDLYYSTNDSAINYLKTSSTYATHITQLQPRLYISSTASAYTADNPAVSYDEYASNDLIEVDMSAYGLPESADDDNRDAQYGVQTWTPNYS